MTSERKIKVIISAKDELSATLDRLSYKAHSVSESIRQGFEPAETAVVRVKERIDALQAGMLSSSGTAEGGAGSSSDAGTDLSAGRGSDTGSGAEAGYAARLAAFREYGRNLAEERERSGAVQMALEMRQAEDEIELDSRKWGLRISQAETAASAMSNAMQNLYVATGSRHRAMFEAMKAFAIAETVIQTYRAAMGAYAALAPIPVVGPALGAAAAAAAVAAGLARVETIRNTKPGDATGTIGHGGRANPSYSGGSASAYPVPQRTEDRVEGSNRNITINIYNPLADQNWKRLVEDNIIPALKDAGDRNIALTVRNMG